MLKKNPKVKIRNANLCVNLRVLSLERFSKICCKQKKYYVSLKNQYFYFMCHSLVNNSAKMISEDTS